MKTCIRLIILILLLKTFPSYPQTSSAHNIDTLTKIGNFPHGISGIDWSPNDAVLYMVSDLRQFVFIAEINYDNREIKIVDSLEIKHSIKDKCRLKLESIRKKGSDFYVTFERDCEKFTYGYVAKGRLGDHKVTINKHERHRVEAENKGIEALAVNNNAVWFAFEAMAIPKNRYDSIQVVQKNLDFTEVSQKWFSLQDQNSFESKAAYDDNGISEIMYLNDSLYLLERAYGYEYDPQNYIKISKISLDSLARDSHTVFYDKRVSKDTPYHDNFEGMTYLPALKKILLVSDDNKRSTQRTVFRLIDP